MLRYLINGSHSLRTEALPWVLWGHGCGGAAVLKAFMSLFTVLMSLCLFMPIIFFHLFHGATENSTWTIYKSTSHRSVWTRGHFLGTALQLKEGRAPAHSRQGTDLGCVASLFWSPSAHLQIGMPAPVSVLRMSTLMFQSPFSVCRQGDGGKGWYLLFTEVF